MRKVGFGVLGGGKFQKLLPSSFRLLTLYHRRDTTYGYNSFFLAATEPDKQSQYNHNHEVDHQKYRHATAT